MIILKIKYIVWLFCVKWFTKTTNESIGQMKSCPLVDVKTIPTNKNRFFFIIIIMCEMIELDNERLAALLRNGLSKVRIHANIYKWFKEYANGSV